MYISISIYNIERSKDLHISMYMSVCIHICVSKYINIWLQLSQSICCGFYTQSIRANNLALQKIKAHCWASIFQYSLVVCRSLPRDWGLGSVRFPLPCFPICSCCTTSRLDQAAILVWYHGWSFPVLSIFFLNNLLRRRNNSSQTKPN